MQTTASTTTTKRLAEFLTAWHWDDVPEHVRLEAKRSLVNCLGNTLAGSADSTAACYRSVAVPFSGPGQATIIGCAERADILTAAFLNGISANVLDFDDTHFPTVMHPSAPLAPPLIALAEMRGLSGPDLLLAFILGFEVQSRIGNAVSTWHYSHGWHITSTCGVFGAAAGAARLLKLASEQAEWALAAAAGQSAGLVENLGHRTKCVQVGNASRNGLAAALYAQAGVEGPPRPIEGEFGFARVMGQQPDIESIARGLGEKWELLQNEYKAYPCGIVLAAVIDACLDLRKRTKPDQIHSIVLRGKPLLRERTDRPRVETTREAVVSGQHTVAVAMLFGRAGLAEYELPVVKDQAVRALASKVSMVDDESIPLNAAVVELTDVGGQTHRAEVIHARGSAERPLSNDELEEKFRQLVQPALPWCDHRRILDKLWTLDRETRLADLMKLLVP